MNHLELAKLGKNDWWRYVLGILIIGVMWQVVGGIPVIALAIHLMADNDPNTNFIEATARFEGISPLVSYIAISCMFIGMLGGIYLVVKFLHCRQFVTLITASKRINWRRYFQGLGVYFALMLIMSIGSYLFNPTDFKFNLNLSAFLMFLPFVLVLTPLQASVEELLFRGYLLQGVGVLIKNKLIVAIASGILFMALHLKNPEVKINFILMPLTYFTMGFIFALITLRDNGLELAMGAHSANNLFLFVFINYDKSAIESPSMFVTVAPEPLVALVGFIILTAIFYVVVYKVFGERKDDSKNWQLAQEGKEPLVTVKA
ncbi:CPBP family intramembrane glutamic endopeptidase [Thiolinea disciformis]|uniref:CPBP family intramembrane glutamic endopeptidase n=1 Tax=Thiolinea disciformis TaxID=125614 RepID=UPI00036057ED|nr:CPBP family intramembrane glutamic endopeptidase [Thiolinea disciformis]